MRDSTSMDFEMTVRHWSLEVSTHFDMLIGTAGYPHVPSARGKGNDSFQKMGTSFPSSWGMLAFIEPPEIFL